MQHLSTGTWASIDERCPLRCTVDGSDLATVVIGSHDQSVELTFNAAGLMRLAEVSRLAVAEMGALDARETAVRPDTPRPHLTVAGGAS